jgi:hypothetical protein
MAFLERAETPSFVAVTGKARTFQPDDSDAVYTSIRPESISTVDAATRDRWTVQTAEQTLQRIRHMATALSLDVRGDALTQTLVDNGIAESLAHGIPLAIDHYGTTPAYLSALRETALDAARVVSGDLDEVAAHTISPDASGDADLSGLVDTSIEATASASEAPTSGETAATGDAEPGEASAEPEEPTEVSTESEPESEPTTSESEESAETPTESEPQPVSTAADSETVTTEPESDTVSTELETETAATQSEPETIPPSDDVAETERGAESGPVGAESEAASAESEDDLGDFEPGEFDLDDDEREEIEEEYGTEFQTGSEVPEPGESDIETPDPEELAEAESEGAEPAATEQSGNESEPATEAKSEATDAEPEPTATDETEAEETEAAEDVDIDDALMDVMEELDDGDGAERDTLVEMMTDRYGFTESEVEDAIQDALMSGQCYEPDDTTLKSI